MIDRYIQHSGTDPHVSSTPSATGPVSPDVVPDPVRKICEDDAQVTSVIILRTCDRQRYIHQYSPVRVAATRPDLTDMFRFPAMAKRHIGLFEAGKVLAIQRVDESAPEEYTDGDAIRETLRLARLGDFDAIAMLHLEGWTASKKDALAYIAKLHGLDQPQALNNLAVTGESLAAKLTLPSVRVILLKDQQDDDEDGNPRIAKAGTFGRLSLNPGSSPDNPFTLLCDNGCWVLLSEAELFTDVREADPSLAYEVTAVEEEAPATTNGRNLHVTFSAKFRTTIQLEPGQTVSDATSDIEIPETEEVQYVPETFEVLVAEDDEGDEVDDADSAVCDECSAVIPSRPGGQLANKHHDSSCSLHEAEVD